jgi:hypothetical protein
MKTFFFFICVIGARQRPFYGWVQALSDAEAADENIFFFIRVIGARQRPF